MSLSCFCWLYRASPSLAAKNIISLISVLTIWWCSCVESSLVLLEEGVCYDQCVLLAKLYYPLPCLFDLFLYGYFYLPNFSQCVHTSFKTRKWKWSRSVMSDSLRLWTVTHQTPLSKGFSRQEYWSGLPFPSPGDLPNPGIEPRSPTLQADALTSAPPGKPLILNTSLFSQSYPILATPWTIDSHASLSVQFPGQEYWSGLPFTSPIKYLIIT